MIERRDWGNGRNMDVWYATFESLTSVKLEVELTAGGGRGVRESASVIGLL